MGERGQTGFPAEEVQFDRLRVSFAPRRDGFALGASLSF